MITNHTPGEWTFKSTGDKNNFWLSGNTKEKVNGNNPVIAEINFRDHFSCDLQLDSEGQNGYNLAQIDWEANKKLIAAAPDMYVALLAAERRLESLQSYFTSLNFTDRYGDADANAGCLLVIKDSIKKATT